jgi:hypothetical protein
LSDVRFFGGKTTLIKFLFVTGSMTHASFYITLLLWNPLPNQSYIVHVLAAIAGISEAANEPVITGKIVETNNLYIADFF